jgi:hypothetical protein
LEEIKAQIKKEKWGGSPLFLEESTELVHHAGATAVGGGRAAVATTVAGGRGAIGVLITVVVAVLLDSILGNAAHNGSTDRSEEAVVSLVTGKTTGGTTGESASKTTLALLGSIGTTLLLVATTKRRVSIMNWNNVMEEEVGAEM